MADWWSYPTNYSGGDSVNSTSDFFWKYPTATLSSGIYPVTIILIVAIAFFVLALPFGMGAALSIVGFVGSILGIFMFLSGTLDLSIVIIFFIITVIGVLLSRGKP